MWILEVTIFRKKKELLKNKTGKDRWWNLFILNKVSPKLCKFLGKEVQNLLSSYVKNSTDCKI